MNPTIGILQRVLQVACLAIATSVAVSSEETTVSIPDPIGYVSDYGRVIEPEYERKLAQIGAELERKTGVRIRVLTVPDLGGQNLDFVAKALLAAWSESETAARNTILILDALAEKRLRIELGENIPNLLTEEVSQRVQKQVMLPNLAQGDRGEAYLLAVTEISVAIGLEQQVALYSVPGFLKLQPAVYRPDGGQKSKLPDILLFIPLLAFMVGMARLETKMARATVVFDKAFRRRWSGRFTKFRGRI
ncbi:TPM domain-containing protein [bacterium]|nr:TPM domain-containing protein [bacterium]